MNFTSNQQELGQQLAGRLKGNLYMYWERELYYITHAVKVKYNPDSVFEANRKNNSTSNRPRVRY